MSEKEERKKGSYIPVCSACKYTVFKPESCVMVCQNCDKVYSYEEYEKLYQKVKTPILHKIGGTIIMTLSSLLMLLFIGVFIERDISLLFPAVIGLFGFVIGRLFWNGSFVTISKEIDNIHYAKKEFKLNNSSIVNMSGREFEFFCAEVLKKNGFYGVYVTPGSGDQGVDIIAEKNGLKYAFQCKHYSSSLGNKPVQEVVAGKQFYGCDVAVVITNSTFTSGAISLAQATGVELWDGNRLKKMS